MAQRNGNNNSTRTRSTPPPRDDDDEQGGGGFDDDQRNEITSIVNAAVSGQLARKLSAAIGTAMDTALAPLRDQMEQLSRNRGRSSEGDGDEDDGEQTPPKGKQAAPGRRGPDPEVEGMKKRMAAMEAEREEERTAARNQQRDTMLREHLEAAGVDKQRIRGAIAVLRESTTYDKKAGAWSYKAKRDGYEEDVDLSEGVSEWAGTDEGKSYLAPQGGQRTETPRGGAGTRHNAGTPQLRGGGRPAPSAEQAKADRHQKAMETLQQGIQGLTGGEIPLG